MMEGLIDLKDKLEDTHMKHIRTQQINSQGCFARLLGGRLRGRYDGMECTHEAGRRKAHSVKNDLAGLHACDR